VAYSDALRLAGCQPLLVTAGGAAEFAALLEIADGILLPGSPNNVHPSHFQEEILDPTLPLDPERDALTLPLIRSAIPRGIPLLGICRGHQEINVALGGSLHQAIHRIPGNDNHQPAVNDSPTTSKMKTRSARPSDKRRGASLPLPITHKFLGFEIFDRPR
jgi:putative glutamine amidotransferase